MLTKSKSDKYTDVHSCLNQPSAVYVDAAFVNWLSGSQSCRSH